MNNTNLFPLDMAFIGKMIKDVSMRGRKGPGALQDLQKKYDELYCLLGKQIETTISTLFFVQYINKIIEQYLDALQFACCATEEIVSHQDCVKKFKEEKERQGEIRACFIKTFSSNFIGLEQAAETVDKSYQPKRRGSNVYTIGNPFCQLYLLSPN